MKKETKNLSTKLETRNKTLKGTVVSDKMAKTVVVEVKRFIKHPKYGKYFSLSKKYKVHDENGKAKMGDEVEIRECRPLSKDKHFEVI
jgi:small subunit ribosomal protein S17